MVMLKISWVHTSASAMTDLMITTEKKKSKSVKKVNNKQTCKCTRDRDK